MRIVIATAVYYPQINGVAVFSHNLAKGLVARGHEVMVLCPSQTGKNYTSKEDGVLVTRLKSIDVKVYPDQIHAVPKKKRFWYKKGFRVSVFPGREVRKALKDFRPDVVHIQVSDPIGLAVVAVARKMGIPVVVTEHNQPEVLTEPLKLPGILRRSINAGLSAYFRKRGKKSDFMTMPSERAIDNLILSRGKEFPVPVAAVSNGVDLSHFKSGRVDGEIYDKYGISREGLKVLYIGRVDPEKKVGLAIEAFKKARKVLPKNTEFLIVGDGVDRTRLEKLVSDLGLLNCVRFLGRVLPPDLYELYRIGDVFITASEIETQGIVLIEAAATGLPLIAVNKGAVSEICIDGKNGILCEPGNIAELSDALVKILTDTKLREKFAKASLQVASQHDFEKTLDRFINIYKKVSKNMV